MIGILLKASSAGIFVKFGFIVCTQNIQTGLLLGASSSACPLRLIVANSMAKSRTEDIP